MKNTNMAAANANNNNNINNNAYTNREMYNKSRTGWSEGTPAFRNSDLEDFDGKMTFAKAPNGSIASIYSWYDNTATYYEKIDGKWYEIDAERTKQIQDALWDKYCQQMKAEMETTETTDDKVIKKLTTLNELVDYFCYDDNYARRLIDDVDSGKATLTELLDVIKFGLIERYIVMNGEEPEITEPYAILALHIVNARIGDIYGTEGFSMQPVFDELGEEKFNEYSDIAEDLWYELDI